MNKAKAAFFAAALLSAAIPAGPMMAGGGIAPARRIGRTRQSMSARNERRLAKRRAMNKIAAKSRKINRRNGK